MYQERENGSMKLCAHMRRLLCGGIAAVCANLLTGIFVFEGGPFGGAPAWQAGILGLVSAGLTLGLLVRPPVEERPSRALAWLAKGCELLRIFLVSASATVVIQCWALWDVLGIAVPWNGAESAAALGRWLGGLLAAVAWEAAVFWSGMIRLYTTSVQLGIRHRVLGALCGWIPLLNIYYLLKLIRVAEVEVELETEKILVDKARAESEICGTKYPILMVHGVFFRDFRYLNYWGRIPAELKRNGAVIYYGKQQSAATVEACGQELAQRIQAIVEETGCGKVNVIAHSKGGLDMRAAISHFGAASCVASLTTINTPHRGCLFAEYLLGTVPEGVRRSLASAYNRTLRRFGDTSPDFLGAVNDLTSAACRERNERMPDAPEVWYQSVMSYCRRAGSGQFPLNVSYPLVKHFDGKNDGLVAVDSARWGERFTLLEPGRRRGISHGDMVDLNRENLSGFDVREFYVELVADLKERGF